MNLKIGQPPAPRVALSIVAVRALILGPAGAAGAGLFGAVCGFLLCLTTGQPWVFALWWCLRCAFAGLVAGTVMGAVSGIYHVDETAPDPAAAHPGPAAGSRTFLPSRPAVALYRSGVRARN